MRKFVQKISGFKVICLIAVLVCTIVLIEVLFSKNIDNTDQTKISNYYTPFDDSSQEIDSLQTEKVKIYTVKEYNGIIGVFEDSAAEPCMTEPTQVNLLPAEDKLLITKGVSFESYKELIKFLQNYE